jgi:hypothetical protein
LLAVLGVKHLAALLPQPRAAFLMVAIAARAVIPTNWISGAVRFLTRPLSTPLTLTIVRAATIFAWWMRIWAAPFLPQSSRMHRS